MKIVKQNILKQYKLVEDKSGLFDIVSVRKDGAEIEACMSATGAELIVKRDLAQTVTKVVEASKLLRELGYEVVPPCRVNAKKAKANKKPKQKV